MPTTTEIANLSLSHLGVGKDISNLDVESSSEARACRRFFEIARDATLRDAPWPFAGRTEILGLVIDDPTSIWEFSYRYPADCIKIRRIGNLFTQDSRQTRVPYRISGDATGGLILSNWPSAAIEYTTRVIDTSQFPPDFTLAFSFRLAAYIAPRLTAGDPFKMSDRAMKLYDAEVSRAMATAFNEEQIEENPESEFIRARE